MTEESRRIVPMDDFEDDDTPHRGGRGGRGAGQRRRPSGERVATPRVCSFCVERTKFIDYKKPNVLAPYIAGNGKVFSRRRTGTCAKHQRRLIIAIKRARYLALLPYTAGHKSLFSGGAE